MERFILITLILYFVPNYAESHTNNQQNLPVCVIGAGFSGINLGILLQEKGYEVHVFEKCSRVGGKVDTLTIRDEVLVEMCPLLYQTEDTTLQKYIHQFHLTSIPQNETDISAFDPYSGTILPFPSPNAQQQQELYSAVQQYKLYRSQYKRALDFGYLHATPDLFDPINTWLINKKLTALRPLLQLLITVEGYGSLQDTPALYVLKFISAELLMSFLNISPAAFTLKEGLYVLVSKMASLVKNLYVNQELIALIRKNDHQIIFLKNNYSIERRICGKTILAFPPLLPNLEKVLFDLNSRERSILSQIKISKYATAAHHLPPLDRGLYAEGFVLSANHTPVVRAPIGNGEIVGLVKQSSRKMQNVFTSYSWMRGDYNAVATDRELRQMSLNMDRTLHKMSTLPKTLHKIKTSEYFPHVAPASLKNGFYQKFNSIQGKGGLYYASTLLTFEKMNGALMMSESFVEKYFNA